MSKQVELAHDNPRQLKILYRNWRGEEAIRTIVPTEGGLHFGSNEWHAEPQWLFEALDVEKRQMRQFALSGVKAWSPVEQSHAHGAQHHE